MTPNPHYDAERWENEQDAIEQRRFCRSTCLMKSSTFIEHVVLADEMPHSVTEAIVRSCGRIATTDEQDQIDAAYRVIGKAIAEWVAEKAWEQAKK